MGIFERTRLAVSVDGSSVRFLLCRRRSVLWWSEVALEPRLFRQGFLTDVRGFESAVAGPESLAKVRRGKVLAALPGFQHFARTLRVPKEAKKDLRAVVGGEVRRSIAEAGRNMFVFSQAFGPKNALQQSVFVVAVPRQPLITFLEALRVSHLAPRVLDLRPLAIARAINQEEAIIANTESRSLDVIIVREDVPVIMRSLYLGDDFDSVEYVNGRLVDELARTVSHFNSMSQDGRLSPDTAVYLTGKGASDSRLPSAIEEVTQHPVGDWKPAFDYPDDFPLAEFVVHIGLMMK